MPEKRRTGRTARQMRDAPRNAYYVWVDSAMDYARALAAHLGRHDLTIVDPHFFSYRERRGKRKLKVKIVIDHACVLTVSEAAAIDKCNSLEKPNESGCQKTP